MKQITNIAAKGWWRSSQKSWATFRYVVYYIFTACCSTTASRFFIILLKVWKI